MEFIPGKEEIKPIKEVTEIKSPLLKMLCRVIYGEEECPANIIMWLR